jgi:twitching motility protein PilT
MTASAAPVESWLKVLWDANGTDLHLCAGAPPLLRIDGVLAPIDGEPVLSADDTERIIREVLGDHGARLKVHKEVDFGLSWHDLARLRGNAFHERGSLALSLRMIPREIPTPDQLGLPMVVQDWLSSPSGLVIVTGPTGSGKSTTLASMIDFVNRTRPCHILTIEDPIEYVYEHNVAFVNQREIGQDADDFPSALRAALREDPDVLLVGEMRDLESIQATLTIAETGHLVFATMHTNDTAQAVDRIVDVFPAERRPQIQVQLASTLQGMIYQRLLPRAGEGMVAAYEVMVANHAVRNLMREGKSRQMRNVISTSQAEGMQTLEAALNELVQSGEVHYEAALGASLHPGEVHTPTGLEPPGAARSTRKPLRRR